MKIKRSIMNPNLLEVVDESTQHKFYGCNQEWYSTEWQRRAGCGPSVACNIIRYLGSAPEATNSKEEWLSLMEETWEHVTPTTKGMPTTRLFYDSVLAYARAKGLNIECHCCDIPEDEASRPELPAILQFVESGLLNDAPIAFLNLCNGEEKNLYRWHWVTIISLDYVAGNTQALVKILDEGLVKEIDLALWHETTTLGGGFVYFTENEGK